MLTFPVFSRLRLAMIAVIFAALACSPTYNWREVTGADAAYVALFPAKPATHSRPINLDGIQVTMTMTAAEVDGVTFAIGSAQLPDPATVQPALNAMKTAMVRNIGGTIRREKSSASTASPIPSTEIEALGTPAAKPGGQPMLLMARFVARNQRVYQVVVLGREQAVSREAAETFFASFKLS
jgi:hypothetical protein